jgi:hypothetical protein
MSVELVGALLAKIAANAEITEADLLGLSEPPRSTLARRIYERDHDERGSIDRQECQTFFGHGASKQIALELSGELVCYNDGGKKRIEIRSVHNRQLRLIVESYAAGSAVPLPVREVASGFRRKRRARTSRTPQELAALQRANARRSEEARARRETQPERAETAVSADV